jgi:hypothetical protein
VTGRVQIEHALFDELERDDGRERLADRGDRPERAQATVERAALVSADEALHAYGLRVIW